MKKAITFISFFSILICSCEEAAPLHKLEKKEAFYSNGKPLSIGYYRDSIPDSLYIHYTPEGKIDTMGMYKNGKKEGQWRECVITGVITELHHYPTFKNGSVAEYTDSSWIIKSIHPPYLFSVERVLYHADSTESWYTTWNHNGTHHRLSYSGEKIIKETFWDSLGNVFSESFYNRDVNETHKKEFYPTGELWIYTIRDSSEYALVMEYDKRGKLISQKKVGPPSRNKPE